MRDDTHLRSHRSIRRPIATDIPWMVTFVAVLVFVVIALSGEVRGIGDIFALFTPEQTAPADAGGGAASS